MKLDDFKVKFDMTTFDRLKYFAYCAIGIGLVVYSILYFVC